MPNMRVSDASPEVAAAAGKGPHKDWNTFDNKLEGARFHLLHEAVSAPEFDAAEAFRLLDELEYLAQSYGYAVTDSYLTDFPEDGDDDSLGEERLANKQMQRERIFQKDGEEDLYFIQARQSERLLHSAVATEEAKDFLSPARSPDGAWGPIHARMQGAFCRGRDLRKDQEFTGPRP